MPLTHAFSRLTSIVGCSALAACGHAAPTDAPVCDETDSTAAGGEYADAGPVANGAACGSYRGLSPFGIATTSRDIFWIDGVAKMGGNVWRRPLSGGATTAFALLDGNPRGLAIDSTNLYAAGGCMGYVWKLPLDGSPPTPLTQVPLAPLLPCVHGVAVDARWVYFTADNGLWKVPLAGGDPTLLVPFQTGVYGGGEEIALSATDVYWADDSSVRKAPLDGGPVTVVDQGTIGSGAFEYSAVTTDATDVYWEGNGQIRSALLTGDGAPFTIALTPGGATHIAVDATDVYWTTGSGVFKAPRTGGPTSVVSGAAANAVALTCGRVYWTVTCEPAQSAPK